jgi:enamine deaminase RidA (YjgF/YER057c/UK114 family)
MPIEQRLADIPDLAPGFGYSHAVVTSGRLAFLAGQIAVDPGGNLVGRNDLAAQTRQALHNMQAILRELGVDWSAVVRFTWYVLDTTDLQVIRDVRDEFLKPALGGHPNPASTLVQVAGLFHPGFLVEVDAVVALPADVDDSWLRGGDRRNIATEGSHVV